MPDPAPSTRQTRPRRPSPVALVFAPLPGIGHWAVRRGGRGLFAFMMFAAGVNLLLLSYLMTPVARISPAWGWVLSAAAVLFSLVDVTRIVLRGRARQH